MSVVFKLCRQPGTIDEVDSNAPLYWLKQDKEQRIDGHVHVDGQLTVQDYRQGSWLINDFNAKDLLDRALRTDKASNAAFLTFGEL